MDETLEQAIDRRAHGSWVSWLASRQTFWVFLAAVVACVALSLATDTFATERNLFNVTRNFAFVGIITAIGYLQLFAEPYVMTPDGGPLQSTISVVMLMYKEGFRWWNMGYAAAVAFVLFIVIAAASVIQLWLQRERKVKPRSPLIDARRTVPQETATPVGGSR